MFVIASLPTGRQALRNDRKYRYMDRKQNLTLGQWGEGVAQDEYKKLGFEILASNVFNSYGKRLGEIDFIARRGEEVAFVEVKTRTGALELEAALEAVGWRKQQKILLAVRSFIKRNPDMADKRLRLDVCAILVDKLDSSQYSVRILENVIEVLR